LPFYDFCGFRSVAVNSVYKLQFFTFITDLTYPTSIWSHCWGDHVGISPGSLASEK